MHDPDDDPAAASLRRDAPEPPRARPVTGPFSLLAKPSGPACNLRCRYCFYLEKKTLFDAARGTRMADELLEPFVRDCIESQDAAEVTFGWQGGEPTLRGLDFFRRAVALQQRYAGGRKIMNALQTNGMLLDDAWGEFLAAHGFLVGISIDGPAALHDAYRIDAGAQPTLERVLQGLDVLRRHAVSFNTLTVVNALNAKHPGKVYRFLKEIGSQFIQFIPLVERQPRGARSGALAGPPIGGRQGDTELTRWSVGSLAYGQFLAAVFRQWIQRDVGTVFVQAFDEALAAWSGHGPSLCVHAPTCGRQPVMEHDGTVYACDHYVYPEYRLGNLRSASLADMLDSPAQRRFGAAKHATLPARCRRCEYLAACHGGCPKHRFLDTADGEAGLNYLCAGYRHFFRAIDADMRRMTDLLRSRRAPAEVMRLRAVSP